MMIFTQQRDDGVLSLKLDLKSQTLTRTLWREPLQNNNLKVCLDEVGVSAQDLIEILTEWSKGSSDLSGLSEEWQSWINTGSRGISKYIRE